MQTEPNDSSPKRSRLERWLTPLANVIYGPPLEGTQPSGLGAKLFALVLLILLALLALVVSRHRTNFGTQHGARRTQVLHPGAPGRSGAHCL